MATTRKTNAKQQTETHIEVLRVMTVAELLTDKLPTEAEDRPVMQQPEHKNAQKHARPKPMYSVHGVRQQGEEAQ